MKRHWPCCESVLVLATLLQKFDLHSVPGKPVIPEPAVTLRPKTGIWQTLSAVTP